MAGGVKGKKAAARKATGNPAPKVGRPTKFTPETTAAILSAIRLGATYELAAQAGGVHYDTFNEWVKKGEAGDEGFAEFSESVKRANAEMAVRCLSQIEEAAADGNWQAAAWKLERRFPASYGRVPQEHTGDVTLRVVYGEAA